MRYGLIALCLFVVACDQEVAAESGEDLYQENCGSCHNGGGHKAPHRMFLGMMAPDAILASMDDGIMAEQAAQISGENRRAIAEYIAGTSLDDLAETRQVPACDAEHGFDVSKTPISGGWGVDPGNSRFQTAEAEAPFAVWKRLPAE